MLNFLKRKPQEQGPFAPVPTAHESIPPTIPAKGILGGSDAALEPTAPDPPAAVAPESFDKQIFCAPCQLRTTHTCILDDNGEVIATCPCGQFLKFPVFADPEDFERHLGIVWAANERQVTAEALLALREERRVAFRKMMGVVT